MVLESTVICVDNSDFMRNGDFVPTRLQAQQDAVSLICHSKTRSHPENNVGLLTMAHSEVLVTLTSDVGKLLAKLHQVRPKGNINFVSAIRIAHLVLKHRQGRNHRTRIVVFVGSPVDDDEKELVKLAKRLRKENVNVDIINFGEEISNTQKLSTFINTINGSDSTSATSHLVTVPPGPLLSDALMSSPVVVGEDGAGAMPGGFEFGIDPNEDPELALALRVSMEEQRARQEEESRKQVQAAVAESVSATGQAVAEETDDDQMLKQALAMSMKQGGTDDEVSVPSLSKPVRDITMMSEDEQMAYAMQMSLGDSMSSTTGGTKMETEDDDMEDIDDDDDQDLSEVMNDPSFLQSVLRGLPGVDPQSDVILSAVGKLTGGGTSGGSAAPSNTGGEQSSSKQTNEPEKKKKKEDKESKDPKK